MNAITKTETTALQVQHNSNSMALDAHSMDSMMRVADLMASGRSTIPAHLQKSPADCMAVVMQALSWGMNPFAVAQKTHLVSGHLGYEAQLVNAVIQQSGSIDGRFHYEFKGTPGAIECRVGAVIRGENEITWGEWLCENKVTTKNSPLWKTNPKQQLGYLQVKNWARLYCPGAILGVYTTDEIEVQHPRDMGTVRDVSQPAAPVAPGVLESAENAAADGVASYAEFWKSASAETRKAIGKDEHNRLKSVATAADAARTVDDTPQQPAPTFADVMAAMVAAKDIDALYVAYGQVTGAISPEESELLDGKFNELKEKLGGVN